MSDFSFGSDPEFVLTKKDQVVSAISVLHGKSKSNRHKVGKYSFYYDNVLAECTLPPSKSKKQTIDNFRKGFELFADIVAPCKLTPQASAVYPKSELNHPHAKKIGCKREICAYTLTVPEPDEDIFIKNNLRSAGGHVHIGCQLAQDSYGRLAVIRMLDLFLGIPSIFIDHDPTSKRRKELYGQAGRFREPKHGAEYRSIGNFWLASPKLVGLVYDICDFTLDFIASGGYDKLWEIDLETLNDSGAWAKPDFNPANCHRCVGYDASALRKAIGDMDKKVGDKFMKLVKANMPLELYLKIEEAAKPVEYDFYKEWELEN